MRRHILFLFFVSLSFAVALNAAITGTVVRGDGSPVAGATVRAFVPLSGDAIGKLVAANETPAPIATATTGDDGRFSIDVKGNPVVTLVVSAANRTLIDTAADRDDAGAIIVPNDDVPQRRAVADNKPSAGGIVILGDVLVRSDEQGHFPIDRNDMALVVQRDYAIATPNDAAGEDFVLSRGTTLRGNVVGPDNAPVADAVVSFRGVPVARTASDGSFVIAHAPQQWHALAFRSGALAGTISNNGAANLVAHLKPAFSLTGSVTSSAGPVAGARIVLTSRDGAEVRSAISDAKGRYAIDGLVPAHYFIRVLHPSYGADRTIDLPLTATMTRDIRLAQRPRISGRVIDEENRPIAGAIVSSPGMLSSSTISGRGGEFTLRLQQSGPQPALLASKSGYAIASVRQLAPIAAGEEKSNVTIKLQRGFPLQVKVVDHDRQPIANARVDLSPSATADVPASPVVCGVSAFDHCHTGPDGLMNVRVVEGKYDVRVGGANVSATSLNGQSVTPRNSPLVITVDHAVEVSGRVMLEDGTPLVGARVLTKNARQGGIAISDANGAFTLTGQSRAPLTIYALSADEPPMQSPDVNVTPPDRNVKIVFAPPSRMEGRVTDRATSQPVTAFTISAAPKASMAARSSKAINSDDGTFVLPRVTPGQLDLRVEAAGYVPASLTDLTVEPGRTLSGVEVKLDRGGTVTGHVTAGGQPVAGVRVRRDARGRTQIANIVSDAAGEFTLDGVPPGETTIELTKEGFAPKRKTVMVEAAKEVRVDVELDHGLEIHGRVIDKQGNPIALAHVNANGGMSFAPMNATTGDDGTFSLGGLSEGTRYRIMAQKSGYVAAVLNDVDPASQSALSLTLDRGGSISGHVRGLSEAELGDVEVHASAAGSWTSTRVDAAGNFTLNGVPDGRVTVGARKMSPPNRQSAQYPVDVSGGSAAPVEIDFNEGVSIHGRVTRNGTPVSGGNVNFIPRKPSPEAHSVMASLSSDGSYDAAGLALGDYDVRVFISGGMSEGRPYTVSGSAQYDIDLQGGALRGRITDAATNAPLPETLVFLSAQRPAQVNRNATTDSDGRFLFEAVPDGTYVFRVSHDRYAPAQQTVTVSGGSGPDLSVALSNGTPATIRVVDADTGAAVDAMASVTGGPRNVTAPAVRGDDGTLKVWVEPGRYRVIVLARGYAQANGDLNVPGDVSIPVSRGGTLALSSASGGNFTLQRAGESRPMRGASVRAGATVTIDSLAAGVWSVRKMTADLKSVVKEYTVTITGGQTTALAAD